MATPIHTCTHGELPNNCTYPACPHNPAGWTLYRASLELIEGRVTPMGAESTPERRLFHQVEAPERRADSLDLPVMRARAEHATLRGDADREGVRALGRDVLLLIEALAERSLQ